MIIKGQPGESEKIQWSCAAHEKFYLLTCQRGDLELFEIIDRLRWARAVDRILILKRAIDSMSRTMHSVISAGIE